MTLYKDSSEHDLLVLIKAGNRDAFDELYNRLWSTLFGSAFNVFREREICVDIIQDVFVWFWEHRETWQLTSCKGYLLTAVKFKIANYIRNNKVRDGFFEQMAKVQLHTEEESLNLEVQELQAFIKSFSDQLPGRCREIFELSRYAHLSNKEIAAQLQVSEKTVENQITIALNKLRKKLGEGHMLLWFFL
ncbi:MAG TPA: RNA polymerase sigma-70 factor [Pedobacter sp.]